MNHYHLLLRTQPLLWLCQYNGFLFTLFSEICTMLVCYLQTYLNVQ